MLRLFSKRAKCAMCGETFGDGPTVERAGQRFCSEQHARNFIHRQRAKAHASKKGDDSCCR